MYPMDKRDVENGCEKENRGKISRKYSSSKDFTRGKKTHSIFEEDVNLALLLFM